MQRSSFLRIAQLAAVAVALGLCAGLAHAQAPSLTKDLPKVQIDHKDFKHHKRDPIAHKPIEMHDPKTGKAVKADDTITLPDGKKVKAGPYFTQINALEKKFN